MKKTCETKCLLKVKRFNKEFSDKHIESEQLVALQNTIIRELSGWNKEAKIVHHESLEILVKVYRPDKPCDAIYRRAVGYTSKQFTAEHVMLGYRSAKQLHLEEGEEVIVQPTTWFKYLWHHAQSHIRYPFRIAFWMALIAIISFIFTIASFIISISQSCCS